MRCSSVIVAAVAALAFASPAGPEAGGLKSFKGSLTKDQTVDVSVENAGIRVVSYRFQRELRGGINPFNWGDGPTMQLMVRNDGSAPREFSVAVALFDGSGALVGAATESHGKLKPGAEEEMKIVFKHVNQNVAHASTVQMSVEIRL